MRHVFIIISAVLIMSCSGPNQNQTTEEPEAPQESDAGAEPAVVHSFDPEGEMCMEPLPDEPAPEPCE